MTLVPCFGKNMEQIYLSYITGGRIKVVQSLYKTVKQYIVHDITLTFDLVLNH